MANDYQLKLAADLSEMERGLARITNQLASVVGGLQQVDGATKKTEQSSKAAGKSQAQFATSLNSTRYALYDVSRTMTIAGVALLGLAVLPSKVAVSFEREFANVSRTVQGATQDTKQALIDLSTELPTSFKNLTEIASLGGQLGIGADGIITFTDTVAKLTATTNLSAEVAGTALGRFKSFGLVTTDQFGNLASAILKVGVNSVATETQIVGIATGIAGIGKVAGLSAATLIGYAGSLASVGIQQYAARGTTQRLLSEIQKAATTGGPALDTFAKIAGTSADAIKTSFGTEKFSPIFESLIKNLGDTSITGQDLNTTLSDLGINSVIDRRTLLQLAAAPETVAQAFRDANSGIKDSSTLNIQYGKIADTTAAKITILGNSIKAMLDSIGEATTGPLGGFVSLLTDMTKELTAFLSTPGGQVVAILVTGFSALAGITLLLGGAVARTTATYIGLITSLRGVNAEAGRGVGFFAALNAEMAASGPAGAKAAAGFSAVGKAVGVAGAIFAVGAVAGGLNELIDNFRKWTGSRANAEDLSKSLDKVGDSYKKTVDGIVNSKGLFGNSGFLGSKNAADASRQFKPFLDFLDSVNSFNPASNLAKSFDTTGIAKFRDDIKELDTSLAGEAGKNAGKAASEYSYLSTQLRNAGYSTTEIRAALPLATQALAKNADAVKKAADAQKEFASSVGTSTSFVSDLQLLTGLDEKGITQWTQGYQKSVSTLTDFNSIVSQVQASLSAQAQAQADAAGGNAVARDFYDGQAVSLAQFTTQLQTNNAAQATWAANLVQISTQYGPQVAQPFIDAGYSAVNSSILQQLVDASPEQAQAYIDASVRAAQLASDATATALLASGFLVTNTGEAIGKDTAKRLADGITAGLPVEQLMASLNLRLLANPLVPTVDTTAAISKLNGLYYSFNGRNINFNVTSTGTPNFGLAPGRGNVAGATGGLLSGGRFHYSNGGSVAGPGSGTSDEVPAWLSNGEYVIKASRVRTLGVGFLNALNGGRSSNNGHYAGGGAVSSGITSGIMELGPNSLNAVRGSGGDIVIMLDGREIARASAQGQSSLNRIGSD